MLYFDNTEGFSKMSISLCYDLISDFRYYSYVTKYVLGRVNTLRITVICNNGYYLRHDFHDFNVCNLCTIDDSEVICVSQYIDNKLGFDVIQIDKSVFVRNLRKILLIHIDVIDDNIKISVYKKDLIEYIKKYLVII